MSNKKAHPSWLVMIAPLIAMNKQTDEHGGDNHLQECCTNAGQFMIPVCNCPVIFYYSPIASLYVFKNNVVTVSTLVFV